MARDEESVAAWVNGLSGSARQRLYAFMVRHAGPMQRVLSCTNPNLRFFQPLEAGGMTGADFAEFATCELWPPGAGKDASGHPRWQLNFTQQAPSVVKAGLGQVKTPIKRQMGQDPVLKRIKSEVLLGDVVAWAKLKAIASKDSVKPHIKCWPHHVALATRYPSDPDPIPLNCGSGGSADHQCDTDGCVKVEHLLKAPAHKLNLNRQRCRGIMLIVLNGVILKAVPCQHALVREASGAVDMLSSCAKVQVVELDTISGLGFTTPEQLATYEAAKGKYLLAKASAL